MHRTAHLRGYLCSPECLFEHFQEEWKRSDFVLNVAFFEGNQGEQLLLDSCLSERLDKLCLHVVSALFPLQVGVLLIGWHLDQRRLKGNTLLKPLHKSLFNVSGLFDTAYKGPNEGLNRDVFN